MKAVMIFSPGEIASASILLLMLFALLAVMFNRPQGLLIVLFSLVATLASVMTTAAGIMAVWGGTTEQFILLIGLPDLPGA